MQEEVLDLGIQGVLLFVYGVFTLILGGLGLAVEYRSYVFFTSGEYRMSLWVGFLGVLIFVFALLMVRDKLLRTWRQLNATGQP